MSFRAALVAFASVLAAGLLPGCGLEGQPFESDSSTAVAELGDAVVTPDAISEYPPSSPEAAVLTWWRAVQTRNPKAVIDSYSSEARDELPKSFPMVVVALLSPPASESPIAIDYVESASEDEVTVYAVIESPDPRLDGPLALPMTKKDDKWQITDATFVETLATAFDAALEGDVPGAETTPSAEPPGAGGSQ
jgi:hypothetical protein